MAARYNCFYKTTSIDSYNAEILKHAPLAAAGDIGNIRPARFHRSTHTMETP
jgi:hypothetical protein